MCNLGYECIALQMHLLYDHDHVFKTLKFWPCRCFECSKKCKSRILQHMSMQASSQQHQDMQKSAKIPLMTWATASYDKCSELFVLLFQASSKTASKSEVNPWGGFDPPAGISTGSVQQCGNLSTHHLETVWMEVWIIKKKKTVWSRVIRISQWAYIPLQANLTLASDSSLDGDKKEREGVR